MNSRLLQNHIVRTTGKLVQLKDLHNIKAIKTTDGLSDWQATLKHLETLRTNDPGSTIEVLARQDDVGLEMIILQTSAMKAALAAFPEVIQMDGTYATNKAGLPLYGLVAEDAHGRGKLVAVVLRVQPTVTVAEVHVSAPMEDMSDVEPSATSEHETATSTSGILFKTVSPSSLKDVVVPVAKRCRGRPKGTDKSLNVKYGLSQSHRNKPIQSNQNQDPETVTGATCLSKAGVRKRRLPRSITMTQAVPASAEDNCAECGLPEPRKKAKGVSVVNWIQCDNCKFWYHECCVPAMPCSNDDEYVCVRCK